jgi:rod shape determining protein RodA
LYLAGLALLVAVIFFGTEVNGTKGWFVFGPISFQPVEFMKLALAVELARYFGEHAHRRFGWRDIFGSGLVVAVPVVLTMLQPDLGSASLLVGMWGAVLFFAGLRKSQALILGLIGVALAVSAWFFVFDDYQKERVYVFLDPARDASFRGYNITQAKIAIGSGQLFGRGLGFGSQSQLKFLPSSQTDFVFAVIAEELGFVGVSILLLAFAVLSWRILRIAKLSRDNFTSFLAIGIFGGLSVQMVVNIGVDLALLPATGVALPLVSYGGSSLIITLTMLGIVESIYLHERARGDLVMSSRSE